MESGKTPKSNSDISLSSVSSSYVPRREGNLMDDCSSITSTIVPDQKELDTSAHDTSDDDHVDPACEQQDAVPGKTRNADCCDDMGVDPPEVPDVASISQLTSDQLYHRARQIEEIRKSYIRQIEAKDAEIDKVTANIRNINAAKKQKLDALSRGKHDPLASPENNQRCDAKYEQAWQHFRQELKPLNIKRNQLIFERDQLRLMRHDFKGQHKLNKNEKFNRKNPDRQTPALSIAFRSVGLG